MNRFLIFCSGANPAVLAQCPTEITKYSGIGATILFTALLACFSGGYALFTVFQSNWIAIPFGIVWALMIFNLDRVVVSGMRKQSSFYRELLFASPRILLAVFLAVVISKPLELKLFEREIRAQIARTNNEDYSRTVKSVDSAYSALARLESQNQMLKNEIRAKQKEQDDAYQAWIQEKEGSAGSRIPGAGPVFHEKGLRLAEVKNQLAALESRNLKQIEGNQNEIERLKKERDKKIGEATAARSRADGLLAQLEALSQLSETSSGARLASWFITLLFITLETAPVAVKLMSTLSPYRPYDQKLEDLEMQIVESSDQQRALLRHRLDAAAQKEISVLDEDVEIEREISSSLNQQRLATELQVNEELMRHVAAAQTEIAEHIVEKWKAQEMEKIDANLSEYINVA